MKNSFIALAAFSFLFTVPFSAFAQVNSNNFQPKNQLELIAYLQGVLDTLQAQISAKNNNVSVSSRVQTEAAELEVKTEVKLVSSFDFTNQSYVYAWFEYGEGSTLNKATTKTKITKSRGDNEHSRILTNLKQGTLYSYRAVFESNSGTKYYGPILTFGTNSSAGDSFDSSTSGGVLASNSKGSLSTDKSSYQREETIKVSWTNLVDSPNKTKWIGLYKVGEKNRSFLEWIKIKNEIKSGVSEFEAVKTGTYEFRMFVGYNTDPIVVSKKITIR